MGLAALRVLARAGALSVHRRAEARQERPPDLGAGAAANDHLRAHCANGGAVVLPDGADGAAEPGANLAADAVGRLGWQLQLYNRDVARLPPI